MARQYCGCLSKRANCQVLASLTLAKDKVPVPVGLRLFLSEAWAANASLKELAATTKARWICEQAYQQMKEELGLDHFEGRSWTGLHRHALMTMIALCFLQHLRLQERGKKLEGWACRTTTAADPASHPAPRVNAARKVARSAEVKVPRSVVQGAVCA